MVYPLGRRFWDPSGASASTAADGSDAAATAAALKCMWLRLRPLLLLLPGLLSLLLLPETEMEPAFRMD